MSFLPEHPNRRVIAEFVDSLDSDTYEHFYNHFMDIASKEILEEYPLPALADGERTELNDFIKQGLL